MRAKDKRALDDERARVQRVAAAQSARIASWQLGALGVSCGRTNGWVENGWLLPVVPRVYAVGTLAASERARLWVALLYAGPGAMLSHGTAAHWCGLLRYPPRDLAVSTPRRVASIAGVTVHARRHLERVTVNGLAVTETVQTMLDIATEHSLRALRRALAQLDFEQRLDLDLLWSATGPGRSGSGQLRAAILRHNPEFAKLNEGIETDLFELLESVDFDPMPEVNVELEPGLTVDFLFRAHRLVVETDGRRNHGSAEQQLEDVRRDLRCRRQHGLRVIRYRMAQIRSEPELVLEDLRSQLDARDLS